ncbi:tetratricopeptide repeat protein [Zophobihabitans entericus]|uniref:Sel1 repeat family protein n=1 Tax=Zophobihabitans entericus TaxID=1635327 RepID=A0A6G9IAW2_9GAMM|nr:tetratricopeptide repeat protein [Zophobihabitans entericus]QIQ21366.1 sel1 repeat family protein [Zophobihabitans entericus]
MKLSKLLLLLSAFFLTGFEVHIPVCNPYDAKLNLAQCEKHAEQGDARAMLYVGYLYDYQHNYTNAIYWYKRATELGNANAQFNLARMYSLDSYNLLDYDKAIKLYTPLAEKGELDAQYSLGSIMHTLGQDEPVRYLDALMWFHLSAKQGYPYSQFMMGYMFEYGDGVDIDYQEAKQWYKLAAEQGYEPAKESILRVEQKAQEIE